MHKIVVEGAVALAVIFAQGHESITISSRLCSEREISRAGLIALIDIVEGWASSNALACTAEKWRLGSLQMQALLFKQAERSESPIARPSDVMLKDPPSLMDSRDRASVP